MFGVIYVIIFLLSCVISNLISYNGSIPYIELSKYEQVMITLLHLSATISAMFIIYDIFENKIIVKLFKLLRSKMKS